jgi:arylformamidase
MRIYDVSVPLSGALPTFPGDPPFELQSICKIGPASPYALSRIACGSHTGTHVDAPAHFIAGGAAVDELPLEILMGKARVVELAESDSIAREHLEALDLSDDLRLLIKTRMSGQPREPEFRSDYSYLTTEAAVYLAQIGIKLVGTDCCSIEQFGNHDYPAHRALLSAGVVIVEGLDLAEVEPGEYEMACLPLRVVGADGAPARVVLKERQ